VTAPPALGVLVPARNEAAVIERKLRNLLEQRWPAPEATADGEPRPHRLVLVDDQSEDGTSQRAIDVLKTGPIPQGVVPEVIRNDGRPGKAGALAAGLARLATTVDVIVLTDADVILDHDALAALSAAFAAPAGPGMACGSQRFVEALADDGTPTAPGDTPLVPAGGIYDHVTAWVRGLESRGGRLFSVHGQLLAWRTDLGITPTPGIAADDLDLMRQVRAAGRAVVKLDAARFLELKTPPGGDRDAQEHRRARAYFQVIDRCRLPDDASLTDRAHFALYRVLPAAAPVIALLTLLALPAIGFAWKGVPGLSVGMGVAALLRFSPLGRRLARLLSVIARSRRAESKGDLPDRWEMARR
jgi:glycosyltransferase involved in cell wall biosynthesis